MTRHYPTSGQPIGQDTLSASPGRDELDLFDILALAWSEKGFIAIVFASIFTIGAIASLTMLKPSYTSESRLLVILEEDPTPNAAGAGGAFMLPQIMQSESELLRSEAVRRIALDRLGAETVLGEPVTGDANRSALKVLRDGFSIGREPNSSAMVASFESSSAERSALILNAMVDAYLAYRQQVLIESGTDTLIDRRQRADVVVATAQASLDAFLSEHGLASFETDKTAAETAVAAIGDRLRTAQADRDAAQAGAAALRERLANIPENIALYIDNNAPGRLLELTVEREALLSRYQEGAPPVQAIDREIDAIQALIAGGGVNGLGAMRSGPNPVRQAMETDLTTRLANAQGETNRISALQSQLSAEQARVARLRGLEPVYTRLAQNVTAAEEAAATLAGQEAVARARSAVGAGGAGTVRVFDRASVPLEGSSMKKLGLIASFVLAAGIAVFLGLIKAYWNAYLAGNARFPQRQQAVAGRAPRGHQSHQIHQAHPAASPVDDLPVLARIADRSA